MKYIVILMLMSTSIIFAETKFEDLNKEHWAYKSINSLVERGILKENKYKFTFNVLVYDKPNILMNIINLIANHKIHLVTINSNEINKNGESYMNFQITIEISNKNEYKYLLNNMLKMKEIISVDRT